MLALDRAIITVARLIPKSLQAHRASHNYMTECTIAGLGRPWERGGTHNLGASGQCPDTFQTTSTDSADRLQHSLPQTAAHADTEPMSSFRRVRAESTRFLPVCGRHSRATMSMLPSHFNAGSENHWGTQLTLCNGVEPTIPNSNDWCDAIIVQREWKFNFAEKASSLIE